MHVGEPGYGVAVINDSTYGHDVTRTVREDGGTDHDRAALSLVRAPRIPDPEADQGAHRFTYALLPGASIEDAVAEGYALNLPLRVADAAGAPEPVVSVDGDGRDRRGGQARRRRAPATSSSGSTSPAAAGPGRRCAPGSRWPAPRSPTCWSARWRPADVAPTARSR